MRTQSLARLLFLALLAPALVILAAMPGRSSVSPPHGVKAVAAGPTLEIDFTEVNWGAVLAGLEYLVVGDTNTHTPLNPTVSNTGDSPANLCVQFGTMWGGPNGNWAITSFGGKFHGEKIDPIDAGTQVCFTNPLQPGETASLDVLIHVPNIPQGYYVGTLDVGGTVVMTLADVVGTADTATPTPPPTQTPAPGPSPTPTRTQKPGAVGGIAEPPDAPNATRQIAQSSRGSPPCGAFAVAAGSILLLAAGGWYARRRWLR